MKMGKLRFFFPVLALFLFSCGHDYEADTLDLGFYQWNFWADSKDLVSGDLQSEHSPSCGWEEFHRGVGKLVRVPAISGDHFDADFTGVVWFHARFTLPELWAGRDIAIDFGGINGNAQVYLNERLVGAYPASDSAYNLDVTGKIYYVRDNHLSVRIADQRPGMAGFSGNVSVKSTPLPTPDQSESAD
jgi:hypothetical protein